jgi:type VI secretion system protein ImpH
MQADAASAVDPGDSGQHGSQRAAQLQALFDALVAEPWAHDFFAVMRRVEQLTGAPRWGTAFRPADEPMRLSQIAELEFPPAMLARLEQGSRAPRLDVRFFGLFGSQGPLPLHLTEYVHDAENHKHDPVPARFLDIFQHRLITLFYRAWAMSQPVVQHDRPALDRYAAWLGSTIGLAPRLDRAGAPDAVPDEAWLHQAGLLATRSAHPEGLAKILRHYFGVGVAVVANVPHWMPIDPDERSRLGFGARAPRVRDGIARLGDSAVIGTRVWSAQHRLRIRLGPLTLDQYESFCLPTNRAWHHLGQWVRRYAGTAPRWDVQLRLSRAQVPQPALGSRVRLGLTTWLGDRRRDDKVRARPGLAAIAGDRADLRLPGRLDAPPRRTAAPPRGSDPHRPSPQRPTPHRPTLQGPPEHAAAAP